MQLRDRSGLLSHAGWCSERVKVRLHPARKMVAYGARSCHRPRFHDHNIYVLHSEGAHPTCWVLVYASTLIYVAHMTQEGAIDLTGVFGASCMGFVAFGLLHVTVRPFRPPTRN
jgi:hypothetical protein